MAGEAAGILVGNIAEYRAQGRGALGHGQIAVYVAKHHGQRQQRYTGEHADALPVPEKQDDASKKVPKTLHRVFVPRNRRHHFKQRPVVALLIDELGN